MRKFVPRVPSSHMRTCPIQIATDLKWTFRKFGLQHDRRRAGVSPSSSSHCVAFVKVRGEIVGRGGEGERGRD
jgi:hypothetical protein